MDTDTRRVDNAFWDNFYTRKLSIEEKVLLLYLNTNQYTEVCGLYELNFSKIERDTSLPIEAIVSTLEKFTADKKVYAEQGFIFIPNYAYEQGAINLANFPKHVKNVAKHYEGIDNLCLRMFRNKYEYILEAEEVMLDQPSREVYTCFSEFNKPNPNPNEIMLTQNLISEYGYKKTREAFKTSARAGKTNVNYVRGILRNGNTTTNITTSTPNIESY